MNLFEPLQPPGDPPVGAAHALAPGAMLEDFEITQVMGLTGFGILYLATHVVDHTVVALKEYLPTAIASRNDEGRVELSDDSHEEAFQRGLQSFIGESLTLSQFDHPHLLHVSCVWEANGTAYRAMPHLEGSTLLAWRTGASEPASQAQLQALLDGLLGALGMLNDAGLAHGQIEPANILMCDGEHPVLMDFDAVHQAVLSDPLAPHADAYADPQRQPQTVADDLHAVAAVLHFAISGQWLTAQPGDTGRYEALPDVLVRLKDNTSALGYAPEFLNALDAVLALAPADRPASVAAFQALFEPRTSPVEPATVDPATLEPPSKPAKAARASRRAAPEAPAGEYPLNASESVLALLAGFEHRPTDALNDIEPFESPVVPTLTEEAEPALPPMRTSLFDAMDAGDSLPQDGVGYGRQGYIPMPRVPVSRWRRHKIVLGIAGLVIGCMTLLAWQLFS